MDILSHTLSGVAAVSACLPFTDFGFKKKLGALGVGALAGAFPDLDAISLWSGFGQKGADIYTGKLWYSHHGFNHSIFAGLLLVFVILFFRTSRFSDFCKNEKVLSLGLIIGFCAHLLEDMPTPTAYWGGVRLFFPSEVYVGGFGKIWWWNNYDIFLLIFLITIFNLVLTKAIQSQFYQKVSVIIVSSVLIGLIMFQMNGRQVDYNYKGYSNNYLELERQSKEEQKRILGDKLYRFMVMIDNKIPLHF